MNARDSILAALRAGRDPSPPAPPPAAPRRVVPVDERAARFAAVLTKVGGVVETCGDLAAARQRAAAVLVAAGARTIATSDAPELVGLAAVLPPDARVLPPTAPRERLLTADAGVTTAQWGIAETGTLVLASAHEQHRLASLLPALHVAILPVGRLLGTLGEAFAALRGPGAPPIARTITFVTGPSRTADIELELVVGVHGPKALHVLLVAN